MEWRNAGGLNYRCNGKSRIGNELENKRRTGWNFTLGDWTIKTWLEWSLDGLWCSEDDFIDERKIVHAWFYKLLPMSQNKCTLSPRSKQKAQNEEGNLSPYRHPDSIQICPGFRDTTCLEWISGVMHRSQLQWDCLAGICLNNSGSLNRSWRKADQWIS